MPSSLPPSPFLQPPPSPRILPDLPDDLLRLILGCVDSMADVAAAACTCRALASAAADDALWVRLEAARGWADPGTLARLGRAADRAATIGCTAGKAFLEAAWAPWPALPARARCRAAAGVACVECGAPTGRRTLRTVGWRGVPPPLPGLRRCHECAANVSGWGPVFVSDDAVAAAWPGLDTSGMPFALDALPLPGEGGRGGGWAGPAFSVVRLFRRRDVDAAAREAKREGAGGGGDGVAAAAAGLAALQGGESEREVE